MIPKTSHSISLTSAIVLLLVHLSSNRLHAQPTPLHDFITETGTVYQNDLATDGTFLYGTKYDGGTNGNGFIYKIKLDGTGYEVLHYFESDEDGKNPVGSLVLSGTTLYGM